MLTKSNFRKIKRSAHSNQQSITTSPHKRDWSKAIPWVASKIMRAPRKMSLGQILIISNLNKNKIHTRKFSRPICLKLHRWKIKSRRPQLRQMMYQKLAGKISNQGFQIMASEERNHTTLWHRTSLLQRSQFVFSKQSLMGNTLKR